MELKCVSYTNFTIQEYQAFQKGISLPAVCIKPNGNIKASCLPPEGTPCLIQKGGFCNGRVVEIRFWNGEGERPFQFRKVTMPCSSDIANWIIKIIFQNPNIQQVRVIGSRGENNGVNARINSDWDILLTADGPPLWEQSIFNFENENDWDIGAIDLWIQRLNGEIIRYRTRKYQEIRNIKYNSLFIRDIKLPNWVKIFESIENTPVIFDRDRDQHYLTKSYNALQGEDLIRWVESY